MSEQTPQDEILPLEPEQQEGGRNDRPTGPGSAAGGSRIRPGQRLSLEPVKNRYGPAAADEEQPTSFNDQPQDEPAKADEPLALADDDGLQLVDDAVAPTTGAAPEKNDVATGGSDGSYELQLVDDDPPPAGRPAPMAPAAGANAAAETLTLEDDGPDPLAPEGGGEGGLTLLEEDDKPADPVGTAIRKAMSKGASGASSAIPGTVPSALGPGGVVILEDSEPEMNLKPLLIGGGILAAVVILGVVVVVLIASLGGGSDPEPVSPPPVAEHLQPARLEPQPLTPPSPEPVTPEPVEPQPAPAEPAAPEPPPPPTVAELAGQLANPETRDAASAELRKRGAEAEPALIPLVAADVADVEVRREAMKLLAAVGTKASLPAARKAAGDADDRVASSAKTLWKRLAPGELTAVTESLLDLDSSSAPRQRTALRRLAAMEPGDRREEVARKLEEITLNNTSLRGHAIPALKKWAGDDLEKRLIAKVTRGTAQPARHAAMDILGQLGSVAAVEPALALLATDEAQVRKLIRAVGAAAEESLWGPLRDERNDARKLQLISLLRDIGTTRSEAHLRAAAGRDRDNARVRGAAFSAADVVKKRKPTYLSEN